MDDRAKSDRPVPDFHESIDRIYAAMLWEARCMMLITSLTLAVVCILVAIGQLLRH